MEAPIRKLETNVTTITSLPTVPARRFRKNEIKHYIWEYCEKSGIHGLAYLAERRSLCERIFWGLLIIASIVACGFMISDIYRKYEQSPVIISFATKESPIFHIPFPAVTICPMTKSVKSLINYEELVNKAVKKNLTLEEERDGMYMSLVCTNRYIMFPENKTFTEDFFKTLNKVQTNYISFYKFMGTLMHPNTFKPIITEEGICKTFNMLDRDEIFRDNVVHFPDYRKKEKLSQWSIEKGYSDNELITFPRRALLSGAKHSLKIELFEHTEEADYMCAEDIQGYHVVLHTPHSIPRPTKQYFQVPFDTSVLAAIQPKMMVTSEEVRKYNPHVRECYFSDEKYLKYFKIYTLENCKLECLSNYTLEKCGCAGFFMPRDNGMPICGNGNLHCTTAAENELLLQDVRNEINIGSTGKKRTYCDCMPLCSELTYDVEQSQTEWNWEKQVVIRNKAYSTEVFNKSRVRTSILTIFFKADTLWATQRNELYGPTDFLANFGGLLGLFTGFSFLSMVEIFYFLTLRIFCNVRRYKVWTGHQEK